MADNFEIVLQFLARFGTDVEGRALKELPAELQPKLREAARGRLPEAQRDELFQWLKENPDWIGRLAEEIKALRTEAKS